MIYLISGDIGSGKTLKVMQWMEQAAAAGRFIATNILLREDCPFHDDVALIDTPQYPIARDDDEQKSATGEVPYNYFWEYIPREALVVIDEADIYFDSSDHGKMKRACKIYHKQLRKFRHDLVYIVQRNSNMYKRIRDLAGRYIYAENTYRTRRIFRMLDGIVGEKVSQYLSRFNYYEFADPSLDWSQVRGSGHFTYAEASQYFGHFDTEQLLGETLKLIRPLDKQAPITGADVRAASDGLVEVGFSPDEVTHVMGEVLAGGAHASA
jgi:hypothetical protein